VNENRGLALKQGFSAGYFNQPAPMGVNTIYYFCDLHVYPLFVGISGIAVRASEIATGESHKYAGAAAMDGFPLYAVKYLVD
jgi:hypothetical protein